MILNKNKICATYTFVNTLVEMFYMPKINILCKIVLIRQISTSELTLACMMTRKLNLNFVDIAGIRVETLAMYQT